jgi:hypothetical protein
MATLSASVSGRTVTWSITNLESNFDTNSYLSAGICLNSFSNGASSISGVVDTVTPVTYVAPTPPTYSLQLVDSGGPVQLWVAQSGWTGYTFDSEIGVMTPSGSYITLQPNQTGTLYTITGGGTFLTIQDMAGGYVTSYWYESYLLYPGDPGVHGVKYIENENYTNADIGTYTIYGFARAKNGLYYNAGSYSITVLGNGAATIRINNILIKAYPYIRKNGIWMPTQAYIRSGDTWNICV